MDSGKKTKPFGFLETRSRYPPLLGVRRRTTVKIKSPEREQSFEHYFFSIIPVNWLRNPTPKVRDVQEAEISNNKIQAEQSTDRG